MKIVRALGAALLLVLLMVGIPLGLWVVGGSLLPSALPTWPQIQLLLTSPLSGNFLVGAVIVIGWIAWASFTIAVLAEVAGLLRGRRPPRLPALGAQQRLAAVLLAAILLGIAAGPTAATAATPPAPRAQVAAAVSLAPAPPDAATDPAPGSSGGQAHPADAAATSVCEVQPGDTLWDLAVTHLGDGERWNEIAELNYGITQPDGGALTDAHWIEPGWQLQLPSPQTAASATSPDTERVTVQPGDTLYDIAAEELGDGARYPQIVAATQDQPQPGGLYLTDPDLIFPGWQVLIPTDPHQVDAARPDPESQGEQVTQDNTGSDQPNPSEDDDGDQAEERVQEPVQGTTVQEPVPETASAATADLNEQASPAANDTDLPVWAPSSLHTVGGVGALLAAGAGAMILARRRQVARSCPPGARVELPEPGSSTAEFEQELRSVADPIGREAINLALRDLAAHAAPTAAPAPAVLFVRYASDGTELQVYLAEPAALPPPWVGSADQQVWSVTDDDLNEHILPRTDPQDVPAAYPALVGLGLGDQDTHLLVDLERLGHLDLRGDEPTAHGVLAALVLELVSSQWADDLQVTVVGGHAELMHVLSSARALHLPTTQQALDRLQTLPRGTEPATRQWPPEVVFFAVDLTQDERNQLAELLQTNAPGLAVVTIGADLGTAAIQLRPHTLDATLLPSGMSIQAQHLSPAEYGEIRAILDAHHVPGPAWTSPLAQAREPAVADLPDPDSTEQLTAVEPQEPLFTVAHTCPQVRMLGPVELVGSDTAVLSGTIGHLHAAVEMTAYLSLHEGATAEQLTTALWPNQDVKPATRHSATSRTRRLLGTTPQGRARLESETGSGASSTKFYLSDVGSDWADFTTLRGTNPSTTPLPDLRRALMLVRGAPFSQVRDGLGRVRANRYLWSDTIALEMTASIVDVACEAARRALIDGKPRLAAEAADAGLRASTDHERLWRYAISARTQMGEHAAAAELMDALTQRLTDLDVDPEPETNDLLDQIAAIQRRQAS